MTESFNAALQTLLSLTAADALGAATEFKSPEQIQRQYGLITTYEPGSVFGFAPGEGTDDSQMTVATLLGYAQGEGLQGVLQALLDWVDARPPDVGGLTRTALAYRTLDGGYRAWEASGRNSAGNGGLMRIASVWIAGFRGQELLRQAAQVTALTHTDPRCVLASLFFVAFLEALAHGVGYDEAAQLAWEQARTFGAGAALGAILPHWNEAEYAQATKKAVPLVEQAIRDGLSVGAVSQSGYVLGTLQAAIAHGRRETWLACVQPAVMLGDDSDTVACVTGALTGARGLGIPEHLLSPLRLGHDWPGWSRRWSCAEHYPEVLRRARQGAGL